MLVGATFLWTAGIKAVAPQKFQDHLTFLKIPLGAHVKTWARLAAGLEAAWGVALVSGIASAVLYPATAIVLVALGALTWWSVSSGRTDDCGCYGGFIAASLWQSVGLNALFASLCLAAWKLSPVALDIPAFKVLIAIATGIVFVLVTMQSQSLLESRGWALVDVNPLRENVPWRHSWAAGSTETIKGEVLVAFLGPDCPYCSQFVTMANAFVQAPGLPPVIGVIATSAKGLREYVKENDIGFPVVRISASLINRLVGAFPTIAVVDAGNVTAIWNGVIPPDFITRVKLAFFPGRGAAPVSRIQNVG
ncbi:MAG TPA: MauE/DoxX family redox-associated membrane protein [Gemmatimonadaceae bacterium]|nr:MauE/DoxX family redox-associated membrane protein [Gemmatimonadaceae bacterium]